MFDVLRVAAGVVLGMLAVRIFDGPLSFIGWFIHSRLGDLVDALRDRQG